MKRQPKRFPQHRIDLAVQLYLAGESMGRIGARTGADDKTIRRWVREAGHELRKPGRSRTYSRETIAATYARLGTASAAARELGCANTTVLRAIGRIA